MASDVIADPTAGVVEAEEVSLNRWVEVPNSEARDRTRPTRRENGLRHNLPDRVTERTDGWTPPRGRQSVHIGNPV